MRKMFFSQLKRITAIALCAVIASPYLPFGGNYHNSYAESYTNLPFIIEDTSYGIEDESVMGMKITLTDGAELVSSDGGVVMVSKSGTDKDYYYLISTHGFVRFFEVEKGGHVSANLLTSSTDRNIIQYYPYELYEIYFSDSGKRDLYNATTDTYYDYGFDQYSIDHNAGDFYYKNGFVTYTVKAEEGPYSYLQGFLSNEGEVITDAVFYDYRCYKNCILQINKEHDYLVSKNGTGAVEFDECKFLDSDSDIVFGIKSGDTWAIVSCETGELLTSLEDNYYPMQAYKYNGTYYYLCSKETSNPDVKDYFLISEDAIINLSDLYPDTTKASTFNSDFAPVLLLKNEYEDDLNKTADFTWLSPDGSEVYNTAHFDLKWETTDNSDHNGTMYFRDLRIAYSPVSYPGYSVKNKSTGEYVMGLEGFHDVDIRGKYIIGYYKVGGHNVGDPKEDHYYFYNYIDHKMVAEDVPAYICSDDGANTIANDGLAVLVSPDDSDKYGILDLYSGTPRFSGYIYETDNLDLDLLSISRVHRFDNLGWLCQLSYKNFSKIINSDFNVIDEDHVISDVRSGDTFKIVAEHVFTGEGGDYEPSGDGSFHILDYDGNILLDRQDIIRHDDGTVSGEWAYNAAYVIEQEKNEKTYQGLIASDGTEILGCDYQFVGSFRNGASYVEEFGSSYEKTVGLVDISGNYILKGMFRSKINWDYNPKEIYAMNANLYPTISFLAPGYGNNVVYLYNYDSGSEKEYQKEAKELALESAIYSYGKQGKKLEKDVLTKVHSIEPDHGKFDLLCKSKAGNDVSSFILCSGKKKIQESQNGNFFNLDPSKFIEGKEISVIVKGQKGSLKTPLRLQIESKAVLLDSQISLINSMDSSLEIQISDEIPVLGGKTVSFDLPITLPVSAVIEDGKIKIGVNYPMSSDDSAAGNTTKPKEFQSIAEQLEQGEKDAVKSGEVLQKVLGKKIDDLSQTDISADIPFMEKNVKISAVGYFEGEWSDKIDSVSGSIAIVLQGEATLQWQFVIIVPVTANVEVSGSASAGGKAKFFLSSDDSPFDGNISSDINVSLEPYIGVGAGQWISGGCYGNLTSGVNIIWVSTVEKGGPTKFFITGDVGAKAYLATKEYKVALISMNDMRKIKSLAPYINDDNELLIWSRYGGSLTNKSVSSNAANNIQKRLYKSPDEFFEMSNISTSRQLKSANRNDELIQNSYPAAEPKLASIDGTTILTYVDVDQSRAEANQTVLKYSVYDEDTGLFSPALAAEDDGTADAMPELLESNGDLYLCWQDSKTEYAEGEDPDLNTYANSFGISVAKYDKIEKKFINLGNPDAGEQYCYVPSLSMTDQGLQCTWAENSDGNIFGVTGRNDIFRSVYSDGKWSVPEAVASDVKCITGLSTGKLGSENATAYVTDTDNDLTTEEKEMHVVAGGIAGSLNEKGNISHPLFVNINGEDNLIYNFNGSVRSMSGTDKSTSELVPSGNMDLYSDLKVCDNKIYYLKSDQSSRNVFRAEQNGDIWNSIPITTEDTYVDSFDVTGQKLVCVTSSVDLESEDMDSVSSLKFMNNINNSELVLDAVLFDTEAINEGNDLDVQLYLTNNGTDAVSNMEASICKKGSSEIIQTVPVDASLAPGESIDKTVQFTLPPELDPAEYVVTVTEPGTTQTSESNRYEVDFSKADIVAESDYVMDEDGRFVEVKVSNTGRSKATTTTRINNQNDAVLAEYVDEIDAGESKTYRYEIDDSLVDLSGDGSVLIVNCETDAEEYYEYNNTDEVRVWDIDASQPTAINNGPTVRVEEIIEALPAVEDITDDDYRAVIEAKAVYDSLTEDQKHLVSPELIEKLEAAEIKLDIDPGYNDSYNIEDYDFELDYTWVTYEDYYFFPAVYSDGLVEDKDYTVEYKNNIDVGTAEVVIKGIGEYTGSVTLTFDIRPADIRDTDINLSNTAFIYNGRSITPKLSSWMLEEGKDYKLSYKNNNSVGVATVTATGVGNYEGTWSKTFNINPKGTTLSKLKAGKKSFKATWKKQAVQTTGYQIQYGLKSNFKGAKTYTVKKNKTVKATIKKLKAKKKYYVRIRTYKKVGGKMYYSTWSKAKKIKTK